MKVFKLEIMVIDFDGLGEEGIRTELENTRFANDCMTPRIMNIEGRDIGEWDDSHPLNNPLRIRSEYERLFKQ